MTQLISYPRLFTSLAEGTDSVVASNGDGSVALLYELYVNRTINTDTWTFRRRVLECALRLFGDFDTWVHLQHKNPHVVGYNSEFVYDTLRYLEGEPRRLPVQSWLELLTERETAKPLEFLSPHSLSAIRTVSTVNALQTWCRRPNGFDDLICSLHVLFGRARPSN